MKASYLIYILLIWNSKNGFAQTYTSYFIGDTSDAETAPLKGVCLMGGAGEDDGAMRWFLQRADGGDILVLRTDDSDGYNDYLFNDLDVEVNSVETIVCNSADASSDAYIIQQIKNAEAIWFAGGDQWEYISYWKDTEVEDALNYCINEKGITLGGTSAGMAIQGGFYFSAENGTITSAQALNNPYSTKLTIGNHDFLENPLMENIITDTHFDNPDRKGRTTAFLARILLDYGIEAKAIACNEYNAVCIDENKIAHAFGEYPDYDDIVYFVQINCIEPNEPELCVDGENLNWVRNNAAIKTIEMNATYSGEGSLDLNDWITIQEDGPYNWQNWWVEDAIFMMEENALSLDCTVPLEQFFIKENELQLFPNPAANFIEIKLQSNIFSRDVFIYNVYGEFEFSFYSISDKVDIAFLKNGIYFIEILENRKLYKSTFVKE